MAFQWAASFVPTGRPEATTKKARAVSIGSATRFVDRTIMLEAMAEMCRTIVTRHDVKKFVAHPPNVPEMLGWICWDDRQLYYVYTIDAARREGVATYLLRFAGEQIGRAISMAFMTSSGAALLAAQQKKWWV